MTGRNPQPRGTNTTQRRDKRTIWENTFDMNLWRRRNLKPHFETFPPIRSPDHAERHGRDPQSPDT